MNPLITKGVAGGLKKIEDLFDLPDSLNISRISERLQICISQTKTLFWALHKGFGREFYLIGVLRFIADIAGFAGPLLLGGLLQNRNENDNTEPDWSPYLYALGLCATTWLCKNEIINIRLFNRNENISFMYFKRLYAAHILIGVCL